MATMINLFSSAGEILHFIKGLIPNKQKGVFIMNREERFKMVSAMEFICRNVNNEMVFDHWLEIGVADGDIKYGEMCYDEYYIQDEIFADLMNTFLDVMRDAQEDGGLYCDGIESEEFE